MSSEPVRDKPPAKTARQGHSLDPSLSLAEAVFRSLLQDIQDGALTAGSRLREDDVAQRLNVSRTPVREAFSRLLAKRFVEPAGGRGLIVRSMDTGEVLELYAMREILEGAAARLAAQHISPLEADALKDIHDAFEAASDGTEHMARVNRLFHEMIFRAARNRYLDGALKEMQDALPLLGRTTFSFGGRHESAIAEHRAILIAITARDLDAAEEAARLHIRNALRTRLALLQNS